MGLPAINSLANMEYMLYPTGSGFNTYCPSYANGYQANVNLYNTPYGYGYGYNPFGNYTAQADATRVSNNNSAYNQLLSSGVNPADAVYQPSASDRIAQSSQQTVSAVQNADIDTVANYAAKTKETAQSWSGLPMSAAMFAFMECPQAIKHWWNSGKAVGMTDKIFKPYMETLWKTDSQLIQKAYGQLHAINRAAGSKIPVIGGWFSKPIEEGTRAQLEKVMSDALATKDPTKILEATETLKAARGMDGKLPTAWNWLKNNTWNKAKDALGFTTTEAKNFTPMERIANKQTQIAEAVKSGANASTKLSGSKLLLEGVKSGKVMALFALLIDAPKILKAFTHKDGGVTSGVTQLAQSGTRAFIDGTGWAIGAAVGKAVGVKAGAYIGTMICPGVGTAVGAALGFIGAAVGSIAANKLSHWLMPTDEATRLETNEQKQTAQGQAQLVQMVAQKVQSGEKVPDNVMQAAQRMVA